MSISNSLLSRTLYRSLQRLKPPPPLTVSEWADGNRILDADDSPGKPGPWETSHFPPLKDVMDSFTDPAVRGIVMIKSTQVGWSEVCLNVIGYCRDVTHSKVLGVFPVKEDAEKYSKSRLARLLGESETDAERALRRARKAAGMGSDTIIEKKFPNGGSWRAAWTKAPRTLREAAVKVVVFEEPDAFEITPEGEPVSLALRRGDTVADFKYLLGGTPRIKGKSRIEDHYENQSDAAVCEVPCPHCGEYQELVWDQLHWPVEEVPRLPDGTIDQAAIDARHGIVCDGKAHYNEEAVYVCRHCGAEIDEQEKRGMVDRYRWRATRAFNGVRGFKLNFLYSPAPGAKWSRGIAEFLRVKDDPEGLVTFVNTWLGETWEEKGAAAGAENLLATAQDIAMDPLPDKVDLLAMGVDLQEDRIEALFLGLSACETDRTRWDVYPVTDRIEIPGDPNDEETWREVEKLLERRFRRSDGAVLWAHCTGVDTGGSEGFTTAAYNFCNKWSHRNVYPLKGDGQPGAPLIRKGNAGGGIETDLRLVGSNAMKNLIYGLQRRTLENEAEGRIHFHNGLSLIYYEQLTAEKRILTKVNGKPARVWVKKSERRRNEVLDCWQYAIGAAHVLRDNVPSLLWNLRRSRRRRMEEKAAAAPAPHEQPDPTNPEPPRPKPHRPRVRVAKIKIG